MSFSSEFKEFALKGNVMDLAVGVIIGAAFAKIVDSLVNDIIMPIAGLVVGPKGFVNSYLSLSPEVTAAKATNPTLSLEEARKLGNVLAWGNFITVVINFIILAIIIFMLVKAMNRLQRRNPVVVVATT
ncbi:large conductance mechanosensitive channel protein MscL [Segetibacter aerophilus]|uniref:Large-conductance mechanosensitive channel n=1 Tax=Segetibacter aerophilus TaxID=670293 RepID=A0A512BAH9_9BACT|nr:large conductance mechanosensitive channel protein MscL [Segetibacter aerophilus]GEO08966.1 large-conductance mechanosensitive channel [Segetibacter aerophilus]